MSKNYSGVTFHNVTMAQEKDERDKTFLPQLKNALSQLLSPTDKTHAIKKEMKHLERSFAVPARITKACINDESRKGPIAINESSLSTYRGSILFGGCSDPIAEAYIIAEQAFMHSSYRSNSNNPEYTNPATKKRVKTALETKWKPQKPKERILPLVERMKAHDLFDQFKDFIQTKDCTLPKTVIAKILWAEKELNRKQQAEFENRTFTIVPTDGMTPSTQEQAEPSSIGASHTLANEGGSTNQPHHHHATRRIIDDRHAEKVRKWLLRDPSLKTNPMHEFQTEALPAPERGTPEDDIDERQTYLYRHREATYTWFHVERTDGQWVNIGVSSEAELPIYVAMHDPAVDIKTGTITASVKSLRANGYNQILYKTDTLRDRLQAAIHMDKDKIVPEIHERVSWLETPHAGSALINSIVGHIQATGQNPKTNDGVIAHGDISVNEATGRFNSLNGRAEYHTAYSALKRGSVKGFACVRSLDEMSEIARHFIGHATGHPHLPKLEKTLGPEHYTEQRQKIAANNKLRKLQTA